MFFFYIIGPTGDGRHKPDVMAPGDRNISIYYVLRKLFFNEIIHIFDLS